MDSKEDPNRNQDPPEDKHDESENDPQASETPESSETKPDESENDPQASETPESSETKPDESKNAPQDSRTSEITDSKSDISKHASEDLHSKSTINISIRKARTISRTSVTSSIDSNRTLADVPSTISSIGRSSRRTKFAHIAPRRTSIASAYSFTKFKTVRDSVMSIVTSYPSLENITFQSNSLMETTIYSLKLLFGTQVLAMPFAFSYSGWVVGIVSTFFVSAVFAYCFYSSSRLTREVISVENHPHMTFAQVIEYAIDAGPVFIRWLSRPSLYIVNSVHIVYRVANGALVMLFMAQNLAQIFQDVDILWSIRIWLFVVFWPILLVTLIPDLQRLTPFSLVGVVLHIIGIIFIIYFLVLDLPPLNERNTHGSFKEYFLFCGILCYASGPLNNITLGLGWKADEDFTDTYVPLIVGVIISAFMNALVGFLGYWKFGEEAAPSITLNLPLQQEFPHWVRVIFIITSYILYSVNVNIVLNLIWRHYFKRRFPRSSRKKTIYQYLTRVICVTVSLLIAMAMPRLGLLRSLFGIFPNLLIGFVFVPLAELSFHWPDHLGCLKWIAVKNISFVLIGLILLCFGLMINLEYLVRSLIDYGEEYDFLPCHPNSTSGTLKIYCKF